MKNILIKNTVVVIFIISTLFLFGCENNTTKVKTNESIIKNSNQTNPLTDTNSGKVNLNDIKTRTIEDVNILRDKLSKAEDANSISNVIKEYYESNRDKVSCVYFAKESGEFYLNPNENLPKEYDARKADWYIESIKSNSFISEQFHDLASDNNVITFTKAVSKNDINIGVVGIDRIVK